jgi:hypothetical protein
MRSEPASGMTMQIGVGGIAAAGGYGGSFVGCGTRLRGFSRSGSNPFR